MNKILLILSLFLMAILTSCSCLQNGRGLTDQDRRMLHANPHIPLKLNN